ncbi:MAG: hypothetical protein AB7G93_17320 [Bdellovibrionales bacterium]
MYKAKWISILVVTLAAGLPALAEQGTYSVEMARVQMDLTCDIKSAEGGHTDCSLNLKASGKQVVSMTTNESGAGFAGVDQVSDANGQYMLVLTADESKALNSVTLMRFAGGADADSFDASLTITETNSLSAVNISPLRVERSGQGDVKVTMSLVAYGPAGEENLVTARDHKPLADYVLRKIKPAVIAAQKM